MGFGPGRMDKGQRERPWTIHPVWRGIGCFMIILLPIMAWVGADVFMNSRLVPLPGTMYQPMALAYSDDAEVSFVNNYIAQVNGFLGRFTTGQILFSIAFLFVGFGLISIIYAIMYRMGGARRYGRFDAPPIKKRGPTRR